jgi:hypothetical protein
VIKLYHKESERSWLDWLMLIVVVLIALVVVALSFQNTARLANQLGLHPWLTAGLVELLFASLLFLRGRQRATQRNVPLFLEIGYYISLIFVTGVNVWGLGQKHLIVGPAVGVAISGSMWLMESVLVWLWTDSLKPHEKTIRDLKRETMKEIKEMKEIQRLEWLKWEASKPDLRLIKEARKAEEKRKRIEVGRSLFPWQKEEKGLPTFFLELQKRDPIKQIAAELEESKPKIIEIQEEQETGQQQTAEVIPIKRQIGFLHTEPVPEKPAVQPAPMAKKPAPAFQPNMEKRQQAIQTAKELKEELGRIPTKRELMDRGLTDHYSRLALKALKEE